MWTTTSLIAGMFTKVKAPKCGTSAGERRGRGEEDPAASGPVVAGRPTPASCGRRRRRGGPSRDSVDDVRGPVHQSASSLIHHNKGESIEAFEKFWGRYAQKGRTAAG